jgi:hypothetical protein
MKVKCILDSINDELAESVGLSGNRPDYYRSISKGQEYVVLGLSYDPSLVAYYGGKPVIEIKDNSGRLTAVPIFLFEIIDSVPSKHWQIRYSENGSLTMYPESFYKDFYHDDLSEGIPEIVDNFKEVCVKFESEYT